MLFHQLSDLHVRVPSSIADSFSLLLRVGALFIYRLVKGIFPMECCIVPIWSIQNCNYFRVHVPDGSAVYITDRLGHRDEYRKRIGEQKFEAAIPGRHVFCDPLNTEVYLSSTTSSAGPFFLVKPPKSVQHWMNLPDLGIVNALTDNLTNTRVANFAKNDKTPKNM